MEQPIVKKKNKNRSVHFYEGLEDYVKEQAEKVNRKFNNMVNIIIERDKKAQELEEEQGE